MMVSFRQSPRSEHGFWVMFDVSMSSGSLLDHCQFHDRSVASLLALICVCQPPYHAQSLLQPHHLSVPYPLSFASLDTHGNGIAESSWLTDYYSISCRYRLCDDHDARAMFACFGVLLLLLRSGDRFQVGSLGQQGGCRLSFCLCFIRSRMLFSCILMYSCGIGMACMYPHLLCNVDVMISTLQKRFNMRVYPWWDLRVPFGQGRILGVTGGTQKPGDNLTSQQSATSTMWPVSRVQYGALQ